MLANLEQGVARLQERIQWIKSHFSVFQAVSGGAPDTNKHQRRVEKLDDDLFPFRKFITKRKFLLRVAILAFLKIWMQFYTLYDVSALFIVRMRCLLILFLLVSSCAWSAYRPKQYYIGLGITQAAKPFELPYDSYLSITHGKFNPTDYNPSFSKPTVQRSQILSAGANFRILESENFKDALFLGIRASYKTGNAYFFEGINQKEIESFTGPNQTNEIRLQETFHSFSGYFGNFIPSMVLHYRHHATWRMGFMSSLVIGLDVPVQHAYLISGEMRDVKVVYQNDQEISREVTRTRVQDVQRFFPNPSLSVLPTAEAGIYVLLSEKYKLFIHADYVASYLKNEGLGRRQMHHGLQLKLSSSM